jgi:hypothetical protein
MLLAAMALVVMVASLALSQTPARESFSYPQGTIDGLGTASNGFAGPWAVDLGDNGVAGLVSLSGTRFAYADLNWALPYDTTHLQVVKSNAWSDHNRYKRTLASPWPNTAGVRYWVSYMIDLKDSLPVGNTYFMVKLYSASNEILAIGKGGGGPTPAVWTCGSGWPGGAGDDLSTTQMASGPVWLVTRIDMSGNGTDPCRTYMWVDPDPSTEPDTTSAAVKRNTTISDAGINQIGLEFGGDGVDVRLVFDEITLASSFGDLTAASPTGTVAKESFSYPQGTIAGLGDASHGFGAAWTVDPGDNGIAGLVSLNGTRFAYGDLNWALPYDTTSLQILKSNAWADHNRYRRLLAAPWPNTAGQKYWVSYMVDIKSLPVGNTYFMVKLYSASNEFLAIGKGGGGPDPAVWTCGSGWPGGSGDDVSLTQIAAGPVWLVTRIDMSGNGTDPCRTYMWVDPDPSSEPDTTTAAVKRNSTISGAGINEIGLEFGGDGANVRLVIDEINLATSFGGLTVTGVPTTGRDLPVRFDLSQNYPNPFNPSTQIEYSVVKSGYVTLKVYNLLGQEVATLFEGPQTAGIHQARFDGTGLTSGVYFYRLTAGELSLAKKMVLVK